MRFWDSSAIVPLVVAETETDRCRSLLQDDPEIVVWFFTAVEVISALTRRSREQSLKPQEFRVAREQLNLLQRAWSEVVSVDKVRGRSMRLLEIHPLRAADALQLAAALIVAEEEPEGVSFFTLDARLHEAAEKEGFSVP
jgi:predicted nucleic acid-binding protein